MLASSNTNRLETLAATEWPSKKFLKVVGWVGWLHGRVLGPVIRVPRHQISLAAIFLQLFDFFLVHAFLMISRFFFSRSDEHCMVCETIGFNRIWRTSPITFNNYFPRGRPFDSSGQPQVRPTDQEQHDDQSWLRNNHLMKPFQRLFVSTTALVNRKVLQLWSTSGFFLSAHYCQNSRDEFPSMYAIWRNLLSQRGGGHVAHSLPVWRVFRCHFTSKRHGQSRIRWASCRLVVLSERQTTLQCSCVTEGFVIIGESVSQDMKERWESFSQKC